MTKLAALTTSTPVDIGSVLFAGAFAAQVASIFSADNASGEQIVWLPGGLLLAALSRTPEARWPTCVFATGAGAGIAAALAGPSLIDAAIVLVTLLALVPAAAYLLNRACADTAGTHTFRNAVSIAAAILFGLPLLSAALLMPIHYSDGLHEPLLLHASNDALAQALGYVAFLPFWIEPALARFRHRTLAMPKASSIAMALVATAVIGLVWSRFGPVAYLRALLVLAPLPFLALIALRTGFAGTHAFLVLIAAMTFTLSLAQRGPFVETGALQTLLSAKLWVMGLGTATWLLAFAVERRNAGHGRADSGRRLRDLAGKLIEAQEQERSRIARDLHDDVNQRLASASIQLSALRRTVDDKTRIGLDHLQNELIALSEDVRHISHNLHPSMLRETGLKAALGSLCSSQRHRNGPAIDLHVAATRDDLPDVVALCLYRATQEALGNAIRHAGARNIEVRLRIGEREAELTVGDDGRGFSIGGNPARPHGLGLLSLEERAKLLEGKFRLDAAPGKGVRVCLTIPLRH